MKLIDVGTVERALRLVEYKEFPDGVISVPPLHGWYCTATAVVHRYNHCNDYNGFCDEKRMFHGISVLEFILGTIDILAQTGRVGISVRKGTVERALRLVEYFRTTASKVQGIISEDALSELQLAVLSELPDSFTTAEGVAIAGKCGMPMVLHCHSSGTPV